MIEKLKAQIRSPKFKRKVIFELMSNAIAWGVTLIVTQILKSFLIVPKLENGFGVFNRGRKIKVSGDVFDILSWIIIFMVGLIIFTVVEHYAEKYLDQTRFGREEKGHEKSL